MPFKSKAQMKYMFSKHPKIAEKWSEEYGSKGLPEKVTMKHLACSKKTKRGK